MLSGGLWGKGVYKEGNAEIPLVTIVTVTYNAELHLLQALESILNQTYRNIEVIVIDGGSTDKTLEIIFELEAKIDYWISEKDNGIYDAMNKGLKLARGKWIGFKNADDWYLPDAIEKLVNCGLIENAEIYYGNSYSILNEIPLEISPFFTDHKTLGGKPGIDHRSTFFLTEFHKNVPFNLSYKLAADFDVFCRMIKYGGRFLHLNSFISYKRFGGASDGVSILKETFLINCHYFSVFKAFYSTIKSFLFFCFWKISNFILLIFLGEKRYYIFKSRKIKRLPL